MILTVTLNPALDLFLEADRLSFGEVLRARGERYAAGGKGLNVSRVLKLLGVPTRALVAVGGGIGQEIVDLARKEGLDVHAIPTSVSSRINAHLEEMSSRRLIKVNMKGENVETDLAAAVRDHVAAMETKPAAIALAGSLPRGADNGTYASLIRWAREQGIATALDASGMALIQGAAAKPTILKVNREEFTALLGNDTHDDSALERAVRDRQSQGIGLVAATHSEGGALLADQTGLWRAAVPARSGKRAVGAGDAFLAGLLAAHNKSLAGGDALTRALACGTAWALYGGGLSFVSRAQELSVSCHPLSLSTL